MGYFVYSKGPDRVLHFMRNCLPVSLAGTSDHSSTYGATETTLAVIVGASDIIAMLVRR